MDKKNMEDIIRKHAKLQTEQISTVLRDIASGLIDIDTVHPNGFCTAVYMDYDEQDMLNACLIFNSVASNFAIKHGFLTEKNAENKINMFRRCVKDTFGLDILQEIQIKQLIESATESLKK